MGGCVVRHVLLFVILRHAAAMMGTVFIRMFPQIPCFLRDKTVVVAVFLASCGRFVPLFVKKAALLHFYAFKLCKFN